MRTGVFNFLAQERAHFGMPAADGIVAEVAQRGVQRLSVVTSQSLNRKTCAVTEALAPVRHQVLGLFDPCIEHTLRDTVIALALPGKALTRHAADANDLDARVDAQLGWPIRTGQLGIERVEQAVEILEAAW